MLIVPNYEQGTWADRVVVAAKNVVTITEEGDPLQLAMVGINLLTAHLALTKYVELKPGDWIGFNLGNSGVGQYVIGLAKQAGLKTAGRRTPGFSGGESQGCRGRPGGCGRQRSRGADREGA